MLSRRKNNFIGVCRETGKTGGDGTGIIIGSVADKSYEYGHVDSNYNTVIIRGVRGC